MSSSSTEFLAFYTVGNDQEQLWAYKIEYINIWTLGEKECLSASHAFSICYVQFIKPKKLKELILIEILIGILLSDLAVILYIKCFNWNIAKIDQFFSFCCLVYWCLHFLQASNLWLWRVTITQNEPAALLSSGLSSSVKRRGRNQTKISSIHSTCSNWVIWKAKLISTVIRFLIILSKTLPWLTLSHTHT